MASSNKNTKAASKQADSDADKNTASAKKKGTSRAKSSSSGKSSLDKAMDRANADSTKSSSAKSSSAKSSSAKSSNKSSSRSKKTSKRKSSGSRFSVMFRAILLAIIVICSAFVLLFDVDEVNSVAMQPTLNKGDIVLSWAPVFIKPDIREGQVYLLNVDKKDKTPNFLRAIACNGQTIDYREDVLKIDGKPIERLALTNDAIARPKDEPEIWRESLASGASWHIMLPQNPVVGHVAGTSKVEADTCFMAGDNRMAAYDSRHIGEFKREKMTGRALFILRSAKSDAILGRFIKLL